MLGPSVKNILIPSQNDNFFNILNQDNFFKKSLRPT